MIYVLTCTNQLFVRFPQVIKNWRSENNQQNSFAVHVIFPVYLFLEDIGANPQTRSKDFQPSSYESFQSGSAIPF